LKNTIFVPYSQKFIASATGTTIVTVTPTNLSVFLLVTKQTSAGFVVKLNGNRRKIKFNWIALGKVK